MREYLSRSKTEEMGGKVANAQSQLNLQLGVSSLSSFNDSDRLSRGFRDRLIATLSEGL